MSETPAPVEERTLEPAALTDEAVVQRVRAGETAAYEILMRRYNQRLFRAARSILQDDDEAQDAVQEAYVRAYYQLDRYTPAPSFGAWLTRIAVNEALMSKRRQRKNSSRFAHASDGPAPALDRRHEPAELLARGQLSGVIEGAIDRLPQEFRTVFVLRAVQELSVQETAASLGVPENTVKTRFHRARKLMQEMLETDLTAAERQAFQFAGARCDRMVEIVLARIMRNGG